jgi:signal transduction histidine kinase
VPRTSTLLGSPKGHQYCGPDRRGLLPCIGRPDAIWLAAVATSTVVVLPFVVVGVIAVVPWLSVRAWSSGVSDIAFIGFLTISALLLLYWRLTGEAASVPFATAASLVALFVVPSVARFPQAASGYLVVLRAVAVAVALATCVFAIWLPEVRSDLHPARFLVPVLAMASLLALGLALSPARVIFIAVVGRFVLVDLVEGVACVVVATALVARGARSGRPLFVGAGAAALSLGSACVVLSTLPSLFLMMGAMTRLVGAGAGTRSAVQQLVLRDLRGRRRWEAAEGQLAQVRRTYQGQKHDVNTMLSAVDGTLLVLSQQRDVLPASEVDRLVEGVRDEVRALRTVLADNQAGARLYDLSHLLNTVVAVRASGGTVLAEVETGLVVEGHPDKLAVVVDNLLANAAVHAAGAGVMVKATQLALPEGQIVEIVVSDQGPGLPAVDQEHAFERGWRGPGTGKLPGSGLGLYQCRQLVEAEGGSISLVGPAPTGRPTNRGLTALVRIPLRQTLSLSLAGAKSESPIL